jgi:hypothetical protein
MEEKFIKEMEIMKNNQAEMLEMKASINQIWATMNSTISRQDLTEERLIHMNTTYKNSETISKDQT